VDRLYDQNLGFRPSLPMSEALDQISRLCWQLAQWRDNLPTCLKIITSRDSVDDVPPNIENVRLRVLLSLRYLGARILVLRPVLNQFLDLPGTTASNEHQSQWLRSSGAVLLADMIRTCSDVLHISENMILAASRKDQNLLGAWWFSCYYSMIPTNKELRVELTKEAFNASLAVLGVLLIKRIPTYSAELSTIPVADLRGMLDMAMDVLRGLDKGNKTIMRCRDTLAQLLTAYDFDGTQQVVF
jgi:hypothetical protein